MPRSFEAVFGFAPPSAGEREALRVVGRYLRRVGSVLGSRELGGRGAAAPGCGQPAGSWPVDPATRRAVRESVEAAASLCDGLLEAVEPDGAAPSAVERRSGV
jgi:hypothetical protein